MQRLPAPAAARGFTLIELLVSVAIVGLLAGMVLPVAELARRRTDEAQLRQSLREIRRAIDAYKAAADAGLIERKALRNGYPASLQTLVDGVTNRRDPEGAKLRFLRRVPRDPMAAQDGMPDADTWGLRSYASTHEQPQAGDDVFDVYSRSGGTGLNGVPYRQW